SVKAVSPHAESANIIHAPYFGNDRQLWAISPAEDDQFSITNKFSGQAISVLDSSMEVGANVKQAHYTGASHQRFRLIAAEEDETVSDELPAITIYPNPSEVSFFVEKEGWFEFSIYDKFSRLVEQGN